MDSEPPTLVFCLFRFKVLWFLKILKILSALWIRPGLLWHFWSLKDWHLTPYFCSKWILALCVYVCVRVQALMRLCFCAFYFVFNILPGWCLLLWLPQYFGPPSSGMGCDDAIILFLDHVCTGGPGLLRTRWVAFSCGHYLWLPSTEPMSSAHCISLWDLPRLFLSGLVFQLPESLGIIYKFEISLYWWLHCFW